MMRVGLIFAMTEEANVLKLFTNHMEQISHSVYKINKFHKSDVEFVAIISNIGKSYAASATTVLIEKFEVQAIINIGSCGGVECNLGDIIISNEALYHDVDVSAFGHVKGALPKEGLVFKASGNTFNLVKIFEQLNQSTNIIKGIVATGDSFIDDLKKVSYIKNMHENIKALDMEAAAIAQVCYHYSVDFLMLKKVSDLADSNAKSSFVNQIDIFEQNLVKIMQNILLSVVTSKIT